MINSESIAVGAYCCERRVNELQTTYTTFLVYKKLELAFVGVGGEDCNYCVLKALLEYLKVGTEIWSGGRTSHGNVPENYHPLPQPLALVQFCT